MLLPETRISRNEMQRRYGHVRKKMEEVGLNILLVSGVRFIASMGYLRYLTNWAEPFAGETLLFPMKGTPVFFARTGERASLVNNLLGGLETVVGSTADIVANHLKKREERMVGVCGFKSMMADFYIQLCEELPGIQIKDFSYLLDEVRMIKSEEELSWVNKSALLGDAAFQLFLNLVEVGREEGGIFLELENFVKRLGAENTYFMMATDPKPVPKFIDLAFDHYKKGDLILFNAEIAGPGGYYSQLVRSLSMGEPSEEAKTAAEVCLKALEAAEDVLKPGQTTLDVYHTIRSLIEDSGLRMGLHPGHSQGLDIFERPLINDKEDVALQEGMVIVIHPHVLLRSGGGIWMGETFVITSGGYRRLNKADRNFIAL